MLITLLKTVLSKVSLVLMVSLLLIALQNSEYLIASVHAEEKKSERRFADVKTRQRQSVSHACGKKLEPVQASLAIDGSRSTEQLTALLAELNKVLGSNCSSSYEKSQVLNLIGYTNYLAGDNPAAIAAYQKMLAEPQIDSRQQVATRYTLAQLLMAQEDFMAAAEQLEKWMDEATIVSPDGKILLAHAYYFLSRKKEALVLIDAVINAAEMRGEIPKEGWLSLQRVLYHEQKNEKKVVSILKKLVTHYPRLSYWRELGGMYGQLEQAMNQLVSTELVYLQKGMGKEQQLLSLANLYLGAEVPYRAAKVLDDGIAEGLIEPSEKNLMLLGSAWQRAHEFNRAAEVLERAATQSKEGEIWSRLAAVYLDAGNSERAVIAARRALTKGGLKRPDLLRMRLGSALVDLHCYSEAVEQFSKAKADSRSEKPARQWFDYANKEGERRNGLIKSGAKLQGCKKI